MRESTPSTFCVEGILDYILYVRSQCNLYRLFRFLPLLSPMHITFSSLCSLTSHCTPFLLHLATSYCAYLYFYFIPVHTLTLSVNHSLLLPTSTNSAPHFLHLSIQVTAHILRKHSFNNILLASLIHSYTLRFRSIRHRWYYHSFIQLTPCTTSSLQS